MHGPSATGEVADTAYTNGKIYTVDEPQPWAEAVAIKDGKFVVVGSNADVEAVTGDGTEVFDLGGGFAMPGTGDPHIHAGLLMPKRAFCALPGTFYEPTEQMILDALEECIASYPEDRAWFVAQGFSTPAMSPETLTREVLDGLIPDRPAWIEDESGHNAWFNTRAMEASITRGFPGKPEKGIMGEEHALTLEEMIEIYTINSAWTLRIDDVTGSIEKGKYADMIILNHNLFEIPVTNIHKTEVQEVLFKGNAVYSAN